jgi:Ca-activated chloride channel homolog
MNHDDPRLTAYALGDLTGPDVAAVEALLAADPAARELVDEIRATATLLENEMFAAPAAHLLPAQRTAVKTAAAPAKPRTTGTLLRLSVFAASAAAAVVLATVTEPPFARRMVPTDTAVVRDAHTRVPFNDPDYYRFERTYTGTRQGGIGKNGGGVGGDRVNARGLHSRKLDELTDLKASYSATGESGKIEVIPSGQSVVGVQGGPGGRLATGTYYSFGGGGGGGARTHGARDMSGGPGVGSGGGGGSTRAYDKTYEYGAGGGSGGGHGRVGLNGDRRLDADRKPLDTTIVFTAAGYLERVEPEVRLGLERLRVELTPQNRVLLAINGTTDEGLTLSGVAPNLRVTLAAQPGVNEAARRILLDGLDVGEVVADLRRNGKTVRWTRFDAPATESYAAIHDNPFKTVDAAPLSTFGVDVDTASYTNVRRFLTSGQLPPPDAVRIEEMVNTFDYTYAQPDDGQPFSTSIEIAACPWKQENRLVRIGLQGKIVPQAERPSTNLVFLVDVSGSMKSQDKLPLLKQSMKLLVNRLDERDHVGIVTYASNAGVRLASTSCADKSTVLGAIDGLTAGGSTNGGEGIQMAYAEAAKHLEAEGINRVLLATDGDFNVGVTDNDQLVKLVRSNAENNVFLSVLGFGSGNIKDDRLEAIADRGNGHYAYIDSLEEGHRVLVEKMSGTLQTIAKDVKIQVEFNPVVAQSYRLIGYENRKLQARDFADDTKDAGEIGAGHAVTALYEVVPHSDGTVQGVKLEYQKPKTTEVTDLAEQGFLCTVKLRFKQPEAAVSTEIKVRAKDEGKAYTAASTDFRFAASVAAFGMILRGSPHRGNASLDQVMELAGDALGDDPKGRRLAFVELARKARTMMR